VSEAVAVEIDKHVESLKDMSVRLRSAELLLSHKDSESALVVAWSAFESVLRYLTNFWDIPIRPWNRQRAIKKLVSIGHIRRSDCELFIRGLETRNQIVLGGSGRQSVAPLVNAVVGTVNRLIDECNEASATP
jgi:hypothetical protein